MKALNRLIVAAMPLVPRAIVRRVAHRYVAGETLADALETVRALNAEGCLATLDVLGEDVLEIAETERTVEEYLRAQRRFAHLFGDPPRADVIAQLQARADRNIRRFGLLQEEAA